MKKFFLLTSVLLLISPVQISESFNNEDIIWTNEEINLNSYNDLYIYKIDLTELTTIDNDDLLDDSDFDDEEYISEDILNDIGQVLYETFAQYTKEVISINQNQTIDTSKKSLILNMKVEGQFDVETRGMLADAFIPLKGYPRTVTIHCDVLDASTNQLIVSLNSTEQFLSLEKETVLTSEEDRQALFALFEVWAKRFTKFAQKHRN